jgi:deferrochelatase/peroxidase EfeB
MEPREDLISASRFHRIIRRGRQYGAVIGRESALQDEAFTSGIYIISLNANISRQFEFIQYAWIANSKFSGMVGETDPLLGNCVASPGGHPTDGVSLPQPYGPNRRIAGLPQFITVRGGAYFCLPSIRALRFLARQSKKG